MLDARPEMRSYQKDSRCYSQGQGVEAGILAKILAHFPEAGCPTGQTHNELRTDSLPCAAAKKEFLRVLRVLCG